ARKYDGEPENKNRQKRWRNGIVRLGEKSQSRLGELNCGVDNTRLQSMLRFRIGFQLLDSIHEALRLRSRLERYRFSAAAFVCDAFDYERYADPQHGAQVLRVRSVLLQQ